MGLINLTVICPGGQKSRVVFAELACRKPDVLIMVTFYTKWIWKLSHKNSCLG